MRVAMQDVVHVHRVDRVAESVFVAVKNGERFTAEIQPCRFGVGRRDSNGVEVGQEGRIGVVHVSPNEGAGVSDQFVKDAGAADVTAMDEVFDAERVEQRNGSANDQMVPVTVG